MLCFLMFNSVVFLFSCNNNPKEESASDELEADVVGIGAASSE